MSADGPEDRPSALGRAMALSQIGLEMVVPIGLGVVADRYLGTVPWLTVSGAVLGFVGGMVHLILATGKGDDRSSRREGP